MTFDEQDAEYLKTIAEKVIKSHDGKYPLQQLDSSDFAKWEGVNFQGEAPEKPAPLEETVFNRCGQKEIEEVHRHGGNYPLSWQAET